MITGYVPVMIKSLPSAATELHLICSGKIRTNESVLQVLLVRLSKGTGKGERTEKGMDSPGGKSLSQRSNNVLASEPFWATKL